MAGGSTDGGIGNDGGSGTGNSISIMMSGHGEIQRTEIPSFDDSADARRSI